jgi:glycerol-3-phosphate dehydrogenase
MRKLSAVQRQQALQTMSEGVDVLVVGGGITGVSVALDAAIRGYTVGLVEKGDYACGTSSKSTKLVHGGIRYLQNFDFALVYEALVERGLLFENAPWIVSPLAFVLPLYAWNKKPLGTPIVPPKGILLDYVVQSGLLLYDIFAGRRSVSRHRRLSLPDTRRRAPALTETELKHAFVYYDGQTDDVRLTITVLRTAVQHGAVAANYAEVTSFDLEEGKIKAARVTDRITGETYTIAARHVINAGGVFAQRIEELTGLPSQVTVEPAKGVHLVFSKDKIPMSKDAIVLPETDDGRLLFLVPYQHRVVVGTTDTVGGDVDHPTTTEDDVEYLLRHLNRYLNVKLARADIISTYAGFRPLLKSKKVSSAKLSRTHAVLDGPGGMISVVGGKLTTWRRMGEDTINHMAKRDGEKKSSLTMHLPLEGTAGWRAVKEQLSGYPPDLAEHLGASYGANARHLLAMMRQDPSLAEPIVGDLPNVRAEVLYACRYEMAMTLDDVLSRRSRLVLSDLHQGRGLALGVAEMMSDELGWSAEQQQDQIDSYLANLAQEYQAVS